MNSSRSIRILHDHDDEPALRSLRAGARGAAAGGTLLIGKPMAGAAGGAAMGDAYFGLYLWAMGSGWPPPRRTWRDAAQRGLFQLEGSPDLPAPGLRRDRRPRLDRSSRCDVSNRTDHRRWCTAYRSMNLHNGVVFG
jgi:hypothetical protein